MICWEQANLSLVFNLHFTHALVIFSDNKWITRHLKILSNYTRLKFRAILHLYSITTFPHLSVGQLLTSFQVFRASCNKRDLGTRYLSYVSQSTVQRWGKEWCKHFSRVLQQKLQKVAIFLSSSVILYIEKVCK